jgi:hypothetical protein
MLARPIVLVSAMAWSSAAAASNPKGKDSSLNAAAMAIAATAASGRVDDTGTGYWCAKQQARGRSVRWWLVVYHAPEYRCIR